MSGVDKPVLDREVYYPGQAIFKEGQSGHKAFLVEKGQVALTRNHDGQTVEIALIGPKALFGEMAIIGNVPRMATATAVKETVCVSITRHRLDDAMAGVSVKYRTMIEVMLDYIRETLPWESRQHSPESGSETKRDELARRTIADTAAAEAYFGGIDPILRAVFQMLVSYTRKRLSPYPLADERMPLFEFFKVVVDYHLDLLVRIDAEHLTLALD